MQATLRIARIMVVVLWLALLAVMLRGQSDPVAVPAEQLSPVPTTTGATEETWMGVYMRDKKIGYTHHRVVPTDDGYRFAEQSILRLTVMDTVQTIYTRIEATTDLDYALRSFVVSLDSGIGALEVRGVVEGRVVVLRLRTGTRESEDRFPLVEPIYLHSTARSHFTVAGFTPGRTERVHVFDPSAMRNQLMEVIVEGRESIAVGTGVVEAWRVREVFRGIETTVWFDGGGAVLREAGPMGLVAVRETAEEAVAGGWTDEDPLDLMGAIAVPVREPIRRPRALRGLTLRLEGLGDRKPPTDRRQSFRDGLLRIEREDEILGTYTLPYRGAEWREQLHATPFLQVDHPRIRATATNVVGDVVDAREAAGRLRQWVFRELEKRPIASIPNALQALEMKAGDCNEHAVLWAALARSAGLPARIVAGTVYAGGVFLYHAWNEVWLGSGWVSVDAAFDQMPVDATHIKLIEGGPEVHVELVPIIGRLSIKVVSTGSSGS